MTITPNDAIRAFLNRSADRLELIASVLSAWHDDWNEWDFPGNVLPEGGYPFTQELLELIAEVNHSVKVLAADPEEPESDGPSLTWLEDNRLEHLTNTYEFVTWEQAARALNQRILMAQDALQDPEGNAG